MTGSRVTPELVAEVVGAVAPRDGAFEITRLSDPGALCNVTDWVSFGCLPIDLITGGGAPMGRITEIYGDNSTGKSLLATQALVEAQARDFFCVFADVESAVSRPLMEALGVDTGTLVYMTPNTVSEVIESLERLITYKDNVLGSTHPMLFIWDSIAATTTAVEIEDVRKDGLDKQSYASAAIQISKALRSGLPRRFARSNVAAIFINQVRENVGVMFGDKVTTFGGKAVGFYASVRIELASKAVIKREGRPIGVRVKLLTTKNKVFPPHRSIEVPIYYGHGVDEAEAVLDMIEEEGLVTKAGGWYTMMINDEELKFQRSGWCEQGGVFDTNYNAITDMLRRVYK